jgi:hypothetical protein
VHRTEAEAEAAEHAFARVTFSAPEIDCYSYDERKLPARIKVAARRPPRMFVYGGGARERLGQTDVDERFADGAPFYCGMSLGRSVERETMKR